MPWDRLLSGSAIVGGVLFVWDGSIHPSWAESLLHFALLVSLPLVMRMQGLTRNAAGRAAATLQLGAALLVVLSRDSARGAVAASAALPWLVFLLAILVASTRVASSPPLARWVRIAGGLHGLNGGLWLVFSRAGWNPFGFDSFWVLITAVHFHHAGLILCAITAELLERHDSRLMRCGAWGVMGLPWLLAVGITWSPGVEILAALALIAVACVVGLEQLRVARSCRGLGTWALRLSSLCLFAAMTLAVIFATGEWQGSVWISLTTMTRYHGSLNALGFGFLSLLAWNVRDSADATGLPIARPAGS